MSEADLPPGPDDVPTGTLLDAEDPDHPIPERLPVLGVREQIVFPGGIGPLVVIGERSARVVEQVMNGSERLVAVATARVEGEGEPDGADLYPVGTACVVQRMLRAPDGSLRLLVQGLERILVGEVADEDVLPNAAVEVIPDREQEGTELDALTRTLETLFGRMITLVPYLPDELQAALGSVESGGTLSYLVASSLRLESEERQGLLEQADVAERLRRVTTLVNRELEVLELGQKIQQDVKADMDSAQREHFLRQQMKAIQDELGEGGSVEADIAEIRGRLEAANPPPAVREAAERELGRLERVPEASPENGVIRSYLEWIVDLPWATTTEDSADLTAASEILDADHHGLQRIKERILEHLAVVTLNPDAPGPVLCFVGPPGVGKTSLGASIARALGREFARISVGGVRDESEIRGHRRTYVGALPGTIVRALRDAGSMNPVMMIDEIDKMGADVRGDPAAAMLEVLDPAQNDTFRDHYLDLPVDLSRVMFTCTANIPDTIPGPLRDRMEMISLPGYTEEDKLVIAREHLLGRQLRRAGVADAGVEISDGAIAVVISEYTREAGVRQLEQRLGGLTRKLARRVAEGEPGPFTIDPDGVRDLLGNERIHNETARRTGEPGVATGLAVTGAGGEILFVEAQTMAGGGRLTVTGQLGEVMRESAQAALSYVRSHAEQIGVDAGPGYFSGLDIHIHVPAGAIPKDGPSAGVTMVTALVSALSGRSVRPDVAMTGEITLSGQVLPIGGVKEKVLAARRAGITTVVIPALNADQLSDLPDGIADQVAIVLADRLEAVLETALSSG